MLKTLTCKPGCTLSFADLGERDGFPVLVQHGMIASIRDSHLFRRLVERGARVICAARPGYGESSPYALANIGEWAEVTAALVDSLGLARFDVLGISSGAPYAYAVAWGLAERVRGLYILSGVPALYDPGVQAVWPYPIQADASLAEMQDFARKLFFFDLTEDDLIQKSIIDSFQNNCFGPALDLTIRARDWGFTLADVPVRVVMRHSRADGPELAAAAELTAKLLPDCRLELRESDAHFSQEVLDDFIDTAMGE